MAVAPDFTRLLDNARVRLPGVLDNAIRLELFGVLDEFFRGSSLWREEIPVPVNTSQTIYDVESEEYSAVVILRLLSLVNADDIPVCGTFISAGKTAELELATAPSASTTYTATVILTLSDPVDADGYPRIPRWMVEKYRDSFLDGVLGRMYSQPAKPYSSERLAILHLRRFQGAISQARVDADRRHLHGAQAWRFPGGWR